MARQEQFGRLIANLARSLKALDRYAKSFDPNAEERGLIGRCRWRINNAMECAEDINRAVRSRTGGTPSDAAPQDDQPSAPEEA